MSRKLKRCRAPARRTLRIESLEQRAMLDGETVLAMELPHAQVHYPTVETQAVQSPLALDANGDGRIELTELRTWLERWRVRETASQPYLAPAADPAPQKPDVLPDVADYGGAANWHLNTINAPEAWAAGYKGQGVTIAVIDTGADLRHTEIRDSLWTNPDEVPGNGRDDDGNGYVDDVHGWDFANDDRTPQDRNGHGTHVASLIVGARNGAGSTGVAYGSELMVLQGLGADGVGSTRDIAQAVRYAVDEGADIVNLSLSGVRSNALVSAIEYAEANGVLVVAAAGNQGADAPGDPGSLGPTHANVLAVGAYSNDQTLASFSNKAGNAVQVVAPGVGLLGAALSGFAYYSGTSMATPLVSGVAALALSASPDLSAEQLRQLITNGASSSIVGDDSHGAINAATTVAQAAKTKPASTASTKPTDYAAKSSASTRYITAGASDGIVERGQIPFESNFARNDKERREHDENRVSSPSPIAPNLQLFDDDLSFPLTHFDSMKGYSTRFPQLPIFEPLDLSAEAVDLSFADWAA